VFNESSMNHRVMWQSHHDVPQEIARPHVIKQVNCPATKT
jgi:hypothetical protein